MAFLFPPAGTSPELDALLHGAGISFLFSNEDCITHCNRAFEVMFGVTTTQLAGQPLAAIFDDPAQYAAFCALAETRFDDQGQGEINWKFASPQGELLCRIRRQPLSSRTMREEQWLWQFEDITAVVAQTDALQYALRELNALMQNAPIGIIFTHHRQVTKVNREFCRTFRYASAQALKLTGRELFPSDEIYARLGEYAGPRLSRGESIVYETEMCRSDGEIFWAQLVAYVVNPAATDEGTIWLINDLSEARRQEETIRQALLENQVILDSAAVGIVYLKNRIVERCNPQAERIFAVPPGEMIGQSTRAWYKSEAEFKRVADEVYPAIVAGRTHRHEQYMQRRNGELFWCRLTGQVLDAANPLTGGSIWVIEDLNTQHAVEEGMVKARGMLQGIFDSAKVAIIVTDARGVIQMMNATALAWLGYSEKELIGQVTPRLFHDPAEVAEYASELSELLGIKVETGFDAFVIRARLQGSDDREWHYIRRDGSRFPVHLTTSVLRNSEGGITGYIGVAVDITDRCRADEAMRVAQLHLEERVALRTAELAEANAELENEMKARHAIEEKMRQMAHFDGLTGLPNRNLLFDRARQAIAQARRINRHIGVMFIDLDGFKHVNDTLGHELGDALLKAVAERMGAAIREGDTLARHGGDEFVLLVPCFDDHSELANLARRLLKAFSAGIQIGNHLLRTSPSIGIACFPEDAEDVDRLVQHADAAMYAVKKSGKNNFCFFREIAPQ